MLTVLLAAHSYNKGAANNLATTTQPHTKNTLGNRRKVAPPPLTMKSSTFLGAANETMSTEIPKQKTPAREPKSEEGQNEKPPPEKQRTRRRERTRYK